MRRPTISATSGRFTFRVAVLGSFVSKRCTMAGCLLYGSLAKAVRSSACTRSFRTARSSGLASGTARHAMRCAPSTITRTIASSDTCGTVPIRFSRSSG